MAEKAPQVNFVEKLPTEEHAENTFVAAAQIKHQFQTLRDLSDEDMAALNKRVVRKIDWRLMPCITLMFLTKKVILNPDVGDLFRLIIASNLDRINVSNARLAVLQEDLRMSDTAWNAGISTFYVGHLVGQLRGNL